MTRHQTAGPRKDTKTGTWFFVADVGGRDGKRHQAYRRGFRTKAEASAALDKLRGDSREGTFVAPTRGTFGDFLTAEWLPTEKRKLAASTWESYERNCRVHIVPALGRVQLQSLDAGMLNRFYGDLLATGRQRGSQSPGLKARTVRYIGTILHAALDDAVRWRLIPLNPADQADPPAASEAKAPEMKVWTGEQVRRFLALCEGDRYYWPWLFLATTGCRRGEALGLRWADLGDGTASICQEVIPLTKASGVGRESRIVPRTKGGRPRVIELDAATVAALRSWRAHQAQERLLMGAGYSDHGLIFCRPDGMPYHPEQFSKTFDRRVRQDAFADLPVIRLHDYADLRVMPTSVGKPLQDGANGLVMSA
jgi:integrase